MMTTTNKIKQIYESLKRNPDDALAHYQHGCCLAFQGKWEEAWPEMEWRFKGHLPSIKRRAMYSALDWDGEKCEKLLVYQDQGFGDTFQYVRYLSDLKVPYIFESALETYNFFKFQGYNVVLRGNPLPDYDRVVAVCSLPLHCGGLRPVKSYLKPVPHNKFATGKFSFKTGKKKIGIAWAGNYEYNNDVNRSCKPEEFLTLTDSGELVSLMLKTTSLPFTDFSLKIVDFVDTAEIINNLDCVVSVDTAVAHLAAAMGKQVYLVLPYEHDWRWMADRDDTPWYSTVRLFRQPSRGDWKSIFNKIKELI